MTVESRALREARHRRERRIALGFGLPWGWKVQLHADRIVAVAGDRPALPCGHRSVSVAIPDGDLLLAASRFAWSVELHMRDGI